MKKSSSATAAALREVFVPSLPMAVPSPIAKSPYAMKPAKLPDWRVNVRPDGLTYRNEPSLMGTTRKLPSGEIVSGDQ